ncbi:uncharacterized protein LOC144629239 [Oculina patagonica]
MNSFKLAERMWHNYSSRRHIGYGRDSKHMSQGQKDLGWSTQDRGPTMEDLGQGPGWRNQNRRPKRQWTWIMMDRGLRTKDGRLRNKERAKRMDGQELLLTLCHRYVLF